jgi:uncharacterized protein YheU (UPF0270 family)
MVIPHEKLNPEALRGLIEEFVTRPGTDTGYTEGSLDENVEMVMTQLKLGDILVVYDEAAQSANIVPKENFKRPKQSGKNIHGHPPRELNFNYLHVP